MFSRSIKIFQSDGGTEFVNTHVRDFFTDKGIQHRISCPYTPQQNGRAERKHRHSTETGLALLFNAYAPVTFWVDAFATAAYIINRVPSVVLENKSPYELLFSDIPHYGNFREETKSVTHPTKPIHCPSCAKPSAPIIDTPPRVPLTTEVVEFVPSTTGSTAPISQPTQATHPMVTRSKDGIFKRRHVADLAHVSSTPLHQALFAAKDPKGYKSAAKNPQWLAAMEEEMFALHANKTWTLVPRPKDSNVVGSKWVFRTKYHSDGSVDRLKARLVAQGFTQIPGLDYSHTFSPVVKAATVRIILALAVINKWPLHQLDVKNAFLNGHLSDIVFMEQPPGFVDSRYPNHVCSLNKALYGLKQAPRAWFQRLSDFLIHLGFTCSKADPSLFIFRRDSYMLYLLVYVDDIILTGNDHSMIRRFIARLNTEFAIKDLGRLGYFLGLETPRYTARLSVPCNIVITRAWTSYAVNQVSQFLHAPTIDHFQAVKRILRYIKGTLSFGLSFHHSDSPSLLGYSDADWARCLETRRSTYGYSIFLAAEMVWVSHLLRELHVVSSTRPVLLCDNRSALFLSQNPIAHKRAKHIDIDYHFIRELDLRSKLHVGPPPVRLGGMLARIKYTTPSL
ncbi:retrovirus-related pol polyprotein from transposon RE1 [Tanacetum coccineum]